MNYDTPPEDPAATSNSRASSPTAARKASGRPFPPPLSLESTLQQPEQHGTTETTTSGLSGLASPPYSAAASSKSRPSPLTPDRPFRTNVRSPLSPMDPTTRPTPTWNGQGRRASDGREPNGEGAEGSRGAMNRAARLSQSTSSASLSGRPRNAQSVLGYSSIGKKGLSPGRASRNEGVAGGVAVSPASQGVNSSSRYLLTVIPPSHLPHDPPHPRTNPQCSGYGPPEHFK